MVVAELPVVNCWAVDGPLGCGEVVVVVVVVVVVEVVAAELPGVDWLLLSWLLSTRCC